MDEYHPFAKIPKGEILDFILGPIHSKIKYP